MFQDVVLEDFDHSRISVVVLRRDPAEVAQVLIDRWRDIPSDQLWGRLVLDPYRSGAPLRLPEDPSVGPTDRVFAHIAEVLHLREALRLQAPTLTWVDVDAPSLRRRKGRRRLVERLELDARRSSGGLDRLQPWTSSDFDPRRTQRPRPGHGPVERDLDRFIERTAGLPGLDALRREVIRWRS
jgi:hypothetical protein